MATGNAKGSTTAGFTPLCQAGSLENHGAPNEEVVSS